VVNRSASPAITLSHSRLRSSYLTFRRSRCSGEYLSYRLVVCSSPAHARQGYKTKLSIISFVNVRFPYIKKSVQDQSPPIAIQASDDSIDNQRIIRRQYSRVGIPSVFLHFSFKFYYLRRQAFCKNETCLLFLKILDGRRTDKRNQHLLKNRARFLTIRSSTSSQNLSWKL